MALVTLTAENFNETVEKNDIVIIDFWAPWCGPCRSFAPIFEKTSQEFPEITFAKVNTEEEQALAGHFQIRSIPTTMILRDSIVVFQQAGALPQEALVDILNQVKALDMEQVRKDIEAQQAQNA
jgi:thioredoxin 1